MAQLQRLAIAPTQLQAEQILLTTQQQHYLSHVLRLRAGDRFIAMNGQGESWLAVLSGNGAQILEAISFTTELPVSVTLLQALPKGNRFDDIVRSCTELGVSWITPVISDRTLLQPSVQKLERWRRIATEAAEQSERSLIPTINPPVSFTTAISAVTAQHLYLCVTRRNCPSLNQVLDCVSPPADIIIAIGPEGGWTYPEVENAQAVGFQPVSLGSRILRAVTAPIVALSLVAATFDV